MITNLILHVLCILYWLKIGINQDMYECYVEPGAKVPVFYDDYETHEERVQKREEIMAREDVINVTQ